MLHKATEILHPEKNKIAIIKNVVMSRSKNRIFQKLTKLSI